jgi:alpha/beta hydrolase family protein
MTPPPASVDQLPGSAAPFVAGTRFALSPVGYTEAEYAFSGTARAYARSAGGLDVIEEADFMTLLLVYRPTDDSAFNGTVWVEWLNVSGGLDAAPNWIFAHRELMRRGAAWVGVSAQKTGVEGGAGILDMPSMSLTAMIPARYGALHHPGDRFSYDIYAQASAVARHGLGTILDGLPVERVMAIGESQSAFRLTTYVNDIDPVTPVHDGFLIHARGRAAAPLDDDGDPLTALRGDVVAFRSELRVPVLCVESETDLINLGYLEARQDDTDSFVLWEIAGAAHADVYTFSAGAIDDGLQSMETLAAAWVPVSEVYGMTLDVAVNAGPQHYVMNAAVATLDHWVADGVRPPASPRLEVTAGALVVDELGNVRGGIRSPQVDAPTAVLSGLGNSGHAIAYLCGSTVPFDTGTLASLYSSKAEYRARVATATAEAVEAGFFLADDAAEVEAIAAINAPL